MEFQRLRYFIAVAEAEHFHRAADRLHVAQPALSRQIRLLEDGLGVSLFDRLPRGVRLTEAGHAFLVDAKRLIGDLERAREHVRRVANGQVGTLTISFIDVASWHGVVPGTILTFRTEHPEVKLLLQPLDSVTQMAGLRTGKIDIAFLYGREAVAPDIVSRPVHAEEFVVALPASHRLAERAELRLRDLRDENFVWTNRSLYSQLDHALMSACLRKGLVPQIAQEVSSSAHIMSLVAVGIGIGLIPASVRWRLQDGVVLKPIRDLKLMFQINMAWRRDNRSPALDQFVRLALRGRSGLGVGQLGKSEEEASFLKKRSKKLSSG